MMRTSDFSYDLPETLIAQTPVEPRDASRLLVCERTGSRKRHRAFRDIVEYLRPGDALVLNHTRTIPARLVGRRAGTGGAAELLLLRRREADTWEALARPGKRLKPGSVLEFGGGLLRGAVLERLSRDGVRLVRFTLGCAEGERAPRGDANPLLRPGAFEALLDKLGTMPLPPYIRRELADPARYNTVYAKVDGSAATPTAGLHFTPELLSAVADRGVSVVPVLLHVGLGTFRPVQTEDAAEHPMHEEYYEVSQPAADALNAARAAGGRIVCVGTTSVRTLETVTGTDRIIRPGAGMTRLFLTPGSHFHATDALVTNFHLPRSTLLMLVSAFMGRENALAAYAEAVREKYRFFSFGDAMLILDSLPGEGA